MTREVAEVRGGIGVPGSHRLGRGFVALVPPRQHGRADSSQQFDSPDACLRGRTRISHLSGTAVDTSTAGRLGHPPGRYLGRMARPPGEQRSPDIVTRPWFRTRGHHRIARNV